ncbi:VWA domain-containing protein [Deinococcus peraridilitoris]|uniref:Mg-chelatase subunit ChlD n=1 Tax=Deinococcus peraridilitoris (strain DSM 19664 / LMG 22246 / CIP 109416 / KR-200) TaxID=937777 RepID=L0A7N3_DEIPD|nr:VWA domain-containing protein [Deinococcus peraridilitoris]AFZ69177.1 Mg-chelatase subunit ChlD [Deinococcus peraridilitoris DSM 19664]
MSFGLPFFLWLLVLLPVTLWVLWWSARRRAERARAYADPHLQSAVLTSGSARHWRWPLALQLAALAVLLFGAAQPIARPTLPVNKAAVMIALDASRSMLADDVKPSRLEAARKVAREFVRAAPASTRIGFLTFSDSASVLVSPTTDRQVLLDALERVQPAQATSFTGALVSGVRALPGRADAVVPQELQTGPGAPNERNPNPPPVDLDSLAPGAILMLSDGISNRGPSPLVAARFASDHKVKLYAVALGRPGGAVSEIEGQLVFVPFDTRELERLTQLTQGRFLFPATTEQLRELYRDLGTVMRWEPSELDLAGPLAGTAALLMLLGGALALRWQRRVP